MFWVEISCLFLFRACVHTSYRLVIAVTITPVPVCCDVMVSPSLQILFSFSLAAVCSSAFRRTQTPSVSVQTHS